MCCVRWSNEAATVHADITADHRDVPAEIQFELLTKLFFTPAPLSQSGIYSFYLFSSWHRAKPRTLTRTSHSVRTEGL